MREGRSYRHGHRQWHLSASAFVPRYGPTAGGAIRRLYGPEKPQPAILKHERRKEVQGLCAGRQPSTGMPVTSSPPEAGPQVAFGVEPRAARHGEVSRFME